MTDELRELLGKHKSWVCRRLAWLEKLTAAVRQDLQLGLLSPTAARAFIRLPAGNQTELLEAVRREHTLRRRRTHRTGESASSVALATGR
jgi:hypothetical protein